MVRIIRADQVSEYLAVARAVASSGGLVDSHVHATEVIRGSIPGPERAEPEGPPEPLLQSVRAGVIREMEDEDLCCSNAALRNRSSEVSFTAAFSRAGSVMLKAHMELSGVTRALLLPVALPGSEVDDQMRFLKGLRDRLPQVSIGYSLPGSVQADRIGIALGAAVRTHQVRAVKLHPNLSRIDPRSREGCERIEALLRACDDHGLPMIIHGGASPILGSERASHFGALENLAAIDWSQTRTTVVIAHCGMYGRSRREDTDRDLALLLRMLATWPNLAVDTSGLPSQVLAKVFDAIDISRIIFGSDALYVPMWRAVAVVLHAIFSSGRPLRETFSRIAQANPRERLQLH
jgi:hypothetical protein